jgi:hypothetical protein
VSNGAFAVSLVVGAALLALWVDARFPLRQLRMERVVVHAVVALVLIHLIPASNGTTVVSFTVVFGLVLPALVYLCVSAVWFIRLLQGSLGSSWS